MLDVFKKIPKDKFVCYDLTENLEDFKDYDLYSKNEYFKNKIEKIKNWEVIDNQLKGGTRKHQTISEFVFVAETNERFLIVYQLEKRQSEMVQIDPENEEREYANITQCYIFRYDSEI